MKKPFYNTHLDILGKQAFMEKSEQLFTSGETSVISFLNAHCFNVAQKDRDYLTAINHADLLLNDGIGVKIGCMLSAYKPVENMNGTDLIPEALAHFTEMEKKIFLLGGEEGIAGKAKKKLESLIPGIRICGMHSGFFNRDEESALNRIINESEADVVLVGMGVPRQELWAERNREALENVKVIVNGGAVMDFLAEKYRRAPLFFQKTGMEWIYRLLQEPGRLAKRYLIGNFVFLFTVLRFRLFPRSMKS